jgi:hypothetical protein
MTMGKTAWVASLDASRLRANPPERLAEQRLLFGVQAHGLLVPVFGTVSWGMRACSALASSGDFT